MPVNGYILGVTRSYSFAGIVDRSVFFLYKMVLHLIEEGAIELRGCAEDAETIAD